MYADDRLNLYTRKPKVYWLQIELLFELGFDVPAQCCVAHSGPISDRKWKIMGGIIRIHYTCPLGSSHYVLQRIITHRDKVIQRGSGAESRARADQGLCKRIREQF